MDELRLGGRRDGTPADANLRRYRIRTVLAKSVPFLFLTCGRSRVYTPGRHSESLAGERWPHSPAGSKSSRARFDGHRPIRFRSGRRRLYTAFVSACGAIESCQTCAGPLQKESCFRRVQRRGVLPLVCGAKPASRDGHRRRSGLKHWNRRTLPWPSRWTAVKMGLNASVRAGGGYYAQRQAMLFAGPNTGRPVDSQRVHGRCQATNDNAAARTTTARLPAASRCRFVQGECQADSRRAQNELHADARYHDGSSSPTSSVSVAAPFDSLIVKAGFRTRTPGPKPSFRTASASRVANRPIERGVPEDSCCACLSNSAVYAYTTVRLPRARARDSCERQVKTCERSKLDAEDAPRPACCVTACRTKPPSRSLSERAECRSRKWCGGASESCRGGSRALQLKSRRVVP